MFYTVYQITNRINGKIYVGTHITGRLDDGYMGSGTVLKRAQKKHGMGAFEKTILEIHSDIDSMFQSERRIVNEEFIADANTYNIKLGGQGGWHYINNNGLSMTEAWAKARDKNLKRCAAGYDQWLKIRDDADHSKRIRDGLSKLPPGSMKRFEGKAHSAETKAKIGSKNSELQAGSGNSQFGTCWIYSDQLGEAKKVPSSEIDNWIEKGWLRGRKTKRVLH